MRNRERHTGRARGRRTNAAAAVLAAAVRVTAAQPSPAATHTHARRRANTHCDRQRRCSRARSRTRAWPAAGACTPLISAFDHSEPRPRRGAPPDPPWLRGGSQVGGLQLVRLCAWAPWSSTRGVCSKRDSQSDAARASPSSVLVCTPKKRVEAAARELDRNLGSTSSASSSERRRSSREKRESGQNRPSFFVVFFLLAFDTRRNATARRQRSQL